MKISAAFAFSALIVATPLITTCSIETLKPHTHISEYRSHDVVRLLYDWKSNGGKRVKYMYPSDSIYYNTLALSPLDSTLYRKNNIAVSKQDCSWETTEQLEKLKPRLSVWNLDFRKKYGHKSFSLISDANKQIDIYVSRTFGCDLRFYSTSHTGRIAILIDENGSIVSILDDVKSEQDIFKAFAITK